MKIDWWPQCLNCTDWRCVRVVLCCQSIEDSRPKPEPKPEPEPRHNPHAHAHDGGGGGGGGGYGAESPPRQRKITKDNPKGVDHYDVLGECPTPSRLSSSCRVFAAHRAVFPTRQRAPSPCCVPPAPMSLLLTGADEAPRALPALCATRTNVAATDGRCRAVPCRAVCRRRGGGCRRRDDQKGLPQAGDAAPP